MLTDRADLAGRALTIHLKAIPETERRTEADFLAEFEAARPRIMGAILDGISAALRNVDDVQLSNLPRMADFAKWITAAETGLGWEPHSFLLDYMANQVDVSEAAFESDLVAVAINKFVTRAEFADGFRGTATDLLAFLNGKVSEAVRKARRWPSNASAIGNAFTRAAPLLRGKGFATDRIHSGTRELTIIPPPSHRTTDPGLNDEVPV